MKQKLCMVTASGEMHGLINTQTNAVEANDFKHMKPNIKAQLEKEKKEDERIVKVKYINRKGRHERLTKPYCRYAGEPILTYHLIPEHVYELPYGFVKEINEKKNIKRSGLVMVDGKEVNQDGSPLAQDQEIESDHLLVPATF